MLMAEAKREFSIKGRIEEVEKVPAFAAKVVLQILDQGQIDNEILSELKRKLRRWNISKNCWQPEPEPTESKG